MKVLVMLLIAAVPMMSNFAFAHGRLVPTPAGCSNAGDEDARPVYKLVHGRQVLIGYECVQDNRGGGGGG